MQKLITIFFFIIFNQTAMAFEHHHGLWQEILDKHVVLKGNQTLVDYKGLKASPAKLDQYLTQLSAVKMSEYEKFSEKQKLSFLINAYNAFTFKHILNHYPLKSIKKIGGLFSNPWKMKFFTLLDEKRHLDWIEHEKIRVDFKEPRIHFAVNCASIGCPPLLKEAFVAEKLDSQFDRAAKLFLTDKTKNRTENNRLYLSKIFKWYGEDFEKHGNGVVDYVAPLMGLSKAKAKEMSTSYTDYDWNLNEWKK